MITKEKVLQDCTVDGFVVKLPAVQLERKLYQEVAKSLELIGGKWKGGKVFGFVFPSDPTELLEQIANGDKRNLKKEFQFFATPSDLVDELVFLACINPNNDILEPSAGQGAIVKGINRLFNITVDCYELMPTNKTILSKISAANIVGDDFLNENNGKLYDRIIANPPFAKNQDIQHVMEMYSRLKNGGRLVSVTSKHWKYSDNKKEIEFRKWLTEKNANIIEIDNGKFKESGTLVGGFIIVINK